MQGPATKQSRLYAQQPPSSGDVGDFIKLRREIGDVKKEEDKEIAEVQEAYRRHLVWRFRNAKTVTSIYMIASVVLSIFVLAIVGFGLFFSYLQLAHAIGIGSATQLATSLTLSPNGAQVTSSVVGVVVLFLSLFFFHLYLKHVFAVMRFVPDHVSLRDTDYDSQDQDGDDAQ